MIDLTPFTSPHSYGKAAGMERSSLFKHLREMAEEGTVVRAGDRMKPEWEAAQ